MKALASLVLEITDSAVLGYFEPKPTSSCYDDELPRRVRPSCERGMENSFGFDTRPIGIHSSSLERDYVDERPEKHLIIGYGFRHGSRTQFISSTQEETTSLTKGGRSPFCGSQTNPRS